MIVKYFHTEYVLHRICTVYNVSLIINAFDTSFHFIYKEFTNTVKCI